jgi:FkbM family methyltransferase
MPLKSCQIELDVVRRALRSVLPASVYRYGAETWNMAWGASRMGVSGYLRLRSMYADQCRDSGAREPERITMPQLPHPIYVRPGTSDAYEVIHTILRGAYGAFLPAPPVRLIVDAGANIGDSTVWYLSKFPEATVVALEPDPNNYAVLERNCRPYGPRAVLLRAALWPTRSNLQLRGSVNFARISVGACGAPEGNDARTECEGMGMEDVLDMSGCSGDSPIDIFKCDIEGAEAGVFGDSCDSWLRRVRHIAIEIHSDEAHRNVKAATARHGFKHSIYRDIHVFDRSLLSRRPERAQ